MGSVTQVWAHRGASDHAPENTLPAFELALEQGADGVEFDVQLSKDGAVVLVHDDTLDRTTDGHGRVVDHTLAELQQLDARNGMNHYAPTRIPTLDEVLTLLAPERARVNIELKNDEEPYPGLEDEVLAAVQRHKLGNRVVVSSFSENSLRRLHALNPAIELATLYTRPQVRPWREALAIGARAIHPPSACVFGRPWVYRAHLLGLAIRPWVPNREMTLAWLMRSRVDAVITDLPSLACEVRARIRSSRWLG